jgi:hypothetical protein
MLKNLPIGIQTFSEIIRRGDLYVDKTQRIGELPRIGKYFFIARPRRFGKSLTLSTIKEIYQGNRALFTGLWIENHWDWSKIHPVVHLSMSKLNYQGQGLEEALRQTLLALATEHGVYLPAEAIWRLSRFCSRQVI